MREVFLTLNDGSNYENAFMSLTKIQNQRLRYPTFLAAFLFL